VNDSKNVTAAKDIALDLRQAGFTPGAPLHIPPAVVAGDCRAYSRLKCPRCGKRMQFNPWRNGRQYRAVCVCQHCQAATEV
jgi:hypothetical protein